MDAAGKKDVVFAVVLHRNAVDGRLLPGVGDDRQDHAVINAAVLHIFD